ncbi:phospholipid/glycerol acyltransferase [Paraglaciecola sp. T6c]|uniref:lysophospholipid acyltransferase family protein n=1 Tax=Pseudoalteromonas atlantica (strain T6c / ATCC BAA-1087) TaxID=3042615 RepID=UPI00005C5577|nr:lysophospholipid acyltransferase family protein [Paraglaciecola sp. T6c]ABG42519.1 phospholipid/glycerol acyltransferase [Paraglaciecola sp. T6c]
MASKLNTPELSEDLPRIGNAFSCSIGRATLKLMGWQFSGEFPKHKKMIIAVAPHTSNWDFVIGIAVAFTLKLKITFFAKSSLFIPPFSVLLRRWGGLPIKRQKAHGMVEQMSEEARQADNMILCLAPEGTRGKRENWKTGFLHIAYKADMPVFLVAFDYKKKRIELGPVLTISENIPLELQRIYQHYHTVHAKFPDEVATNLTPPSGDKD